MPGNQRNNANELLRWLSDMWVPELSPPNILNGMFGPKNRHFAPKYAFSSFGTLLVGWLVVVARRLHLARHLSTLCDVIVRK